MNLIEIICSASKLKSPIAIIIIVFSSHVCFTFKFALPILRMFIDWFNFLLSCTPSLLGVLLSFLHSPYMQLQSNGCLIFWSCTPLICYFRIIIITISHSPYLELHNVFHFISYNPSICNCMHFTSNPEECNCRICFTFYLSPLTCKIFRMCSPPISIPLFVIAECYLVPLIHNCRPFHLLSCTPLHVITKYFSFYRTPLTCNCSMFSQSILHPLICNCKIVLPSNLHPL